MSRSHAGTLVALFATAAAFSAAPLHTQPIVESVGANSFESSVGRFDGGGTYSTFAQTFRAPTGAPFLQGFSFYLNDDFGQGADLRFRAHVYEFDIVNLLLLGPALFSSPLQLGSTNLATFDAYLFTASPGGMNLALNPTLTYAFVLSALGTLPGVYAAIPDGATNSVGASNVDAYAGGSAWRSLATGQLSDLGANQAFEAATAPDWRSMLRSRPRWCPSQRPSCCSALLSAFWPLFVAVGEPRDDGREHSAHGPSRTRVMSRVTFRTLEVEEPRGLATRQRAHASTKW